MSSKYSKNGRYKMKCKCCGEKASFTYKENGFFKERYRCSNCNKTFWEKKGWAKAAGVVGSTLSIGGIVLKIACGDIPGAVASIAYKSVSGSDDFTNV
ncbi:hypothetical protein B4U84_04810 [Westiellopsis prolifica IICB1]|nr:hypothetical protein B4U84_04810 [Westiellopsis prolifica IICB1]